MKYVGRYASRLRTEAAGHYSIRTDVPYQCGRKRRELGLPWSHAGMLVYRVQRLARLLGRGAWPTSSTVCRGLAEL